MSIGESVMFILKSAIHCEVFFPKNTTILFCSMFIPEEIQFSFLRNEGFPKNFLSRASFISFNSFKEYVHDLKNKLGCLPILS